MTVRKLLSPAVWLRNRRRILPELGRCLRVIESVALRDRWHSTANERRIEALRSKHAGDRAVIIGNGPSLRPSDLTRLQKEITFAANKIYLAFDQTPWRPTYYNVEDPLVIEQTHEQINALKGFPKLLKRSIPPLLGTDEWTVFYDLRVLPPERYPGFSGNPFRGFICGYSVCLSSLQWAYFMGIREVHLIGVDFNFVVPNLDKDGGIVSVGEVNHFHPDYRKPGEKWRTPALEQQLQAFTCARDWLAARGVNVFNTTRGGKLEVFPRRDFDAVFR